MISNSVNNLLRQIQSLSSFFYAFYNTNTLLIMLEPKRTDLVERPLSGMTKRGMPKVMSELMASAKSSFKRSAFAIVRAFCETSSVCVSRVRAKSSVPAIRIWLFAPKRRKADE